MPDLKISELPSIATPDISPDDVIPIVDTTVDVTKKISIAQFDARYSGVVIPANILGVNVGITGGLGKVIGPGNVTITVPQAIGPSDSPAFNVLTVNQLNVDNLRLDGNTLSTQNVDGNLILSPNGAGVVQVTKDLQALSTLQILSLMNIDEENNAVATGTNAILTLPTKSHVNLTNAALDSVQGIANGVAGRIFILTNRTGSSFDILNATGTASEQIITGTSLNLTLENNASIWLIYSSSKWYVIGGSGSGGGAVASVNGQTGVVSLGIQDMDDVTFTTLTAGDIIQWNGSAFVNVPQVVPPVDSVNGQTGTVVLDLDDINDVNITTPTNGEALIYQSGSWVNQALPSAPVDSVNGQTGVVVLDLDDIDGVNLTAPSNGQYLTFNGTNWVNSTLDLSGYVVGPGSAVDEQLAVFNLTTGKLIKASAITASVAGVMSGVTQLNVDNLRMDGQVLSSTNTNGNVEITPNGSGQSLIKNTSWTGTVSQGASGTDPSTTGVAATLTTPTTFSTEVTNASLESLTGISASTTMQYFILINGTGRAITLLNELGTATEQIVTGLGTDMILPANASIMLVYRSTKWYVVGNTNNVSIPLIQTFNTVPSINNFGTVTNAAFNWTIVGDRLVGNGRWTNGTVAASTATFTLPNGWTSNVPGSDLYVCGRWERGVGTATTVKNGSLMCQTGNGTIYLTLDDYTTAAGPGAGANANAISANSNTMYVWFSIPITQLSQNTTQGIAAQANLDYQSVVSSAKTPGATNQYLAMTGNSLTLLPNREYNLRGAIGYNQSGTANIAQITGGIFGSNGADSGSTPTALTATSGLTVLTTSTLMNGATALGGQWLNGLVPTAWVIPVMGVRVRVGSSPVTVYNVPFQTTGTPANARFQTFLEAEEVPFTNTSINTGPMYLGTQSWVDSEANATTSVRVFKNGKFIKGIFRTTFSGTMSGSDFNITIPSQYAASSTAYTNINSKRPIIGNVRLSDAGVLYDGTATLSSTTNIRVYVSNANNSFVQSSNISASVPFSWASGDIIEFTAEWEID